MRRELRGKICGLGWLLAALAAPYICRGQTEVAFQPAVQNFIGARGMALGDAIGSDGQDIESMYQNPATLSFLRAANVMIDHREVFDSRIFQENIAGRLFAGRFGALGLGIGVEHSGKFTKSGPFNFVQSDLDVGYSFRVMSVSTDLSLGVLGNFRMAKGDSASRSAARFSLGLMYSPSAGTSYSVVYRGLGSDISYAAGELAGSRFTQVGVDRLARSLEIGSTLRYPSLSGPPFLTMSIAGEKDFVEKVVRIRGGLELILANIVSLRLGYVSARVSEFRYGFGLSIADVRLDFGAMPLPGPGRGEEVTLKYSL